MFGRGQSCLTAKITAPGHYAIKTPFIQDSRLPYFQPVNKASRGRLKMAVEVIAHYFRREFEYDFLQYSHTDGSGYAAYLFLADAFQQDFGKAAVGAMVFRWREWEDAPHGWALQWVWLHPYFRGKGLLSWVWPALLKEFGDFYPEPPLSTAMRSFLQKRATSAQKELLKLETPGAEREHEV